MNAQEKYSHIRGFNFQPPWGSNGRDVWLRFDEFEYRRLIRCAKAAFPRLNTLRIWLSFDAWLDSPSAFLANVRRAGEVIHEEGLGMLPMYFNGWHSTPDFGGFTDEILRSMEAEDYVQMRQYLRETSEVLERTGAVFLQDISNEPLNNIVGSPVAAARVYRFLSAMSEELHAHTTAPVTIGSQGYWNPFQGYTGSDMEYFAPLVDVISIHPYTVAMVSAEGHSQWVRRLIREAERLCKPVIITECCWGADSDAERGAVVETELRDYSDAGIGFLVHALSPSPVADLHPSRRGEKQLNMPFMMQDGSIRPYHEVFNKY